MFYFLSNKIGLTITLAILLIVGICPQFVHAQTNMYKQNVISGLTMLDYDKSGAAAYNGEFYLVLSQTGRLYKSYESTYWKELHTYTVQANGSTSYLLGSNIKKLIYDGKQFVLVSDTMIYTSIDGVSWTEVTLPTHNNSRKEYVFEDIIFNGKTYYLLAQDRDKKVNGFYMLGPNYIFMSTDLKTYKTTQTHLQRSIFGERPLNSLTTNGTTFIAGGNSSAYSKDGLIWNYQEFPSYLGSGVIWNGEKYMWAYGNSIYSVDANMKKTQILYTLPAKVWNPTTKKKEPLTSLSLRTISYKGNEYIASGSTDGDRKANYKTVFLYSKNGHDWELQSIVNGNTPIYTILPTPQGFLLIGNNVWNVSTQSLPIATESTKAALDQESKKINY